MRLVLVTLLFAALVQAQKPRARDLGIPFDGAPGALNAVTDIAGIEVGHATIIAGEGAHAARTGVTAVWPRGKQSFDPVFGAWFSLNGNGEMTGTTWVEESGFVDGPVLITNTHSVGVVRDAFIAWLANHGRHPGTNSFRDNFFVMPIVAETFDGFLNDTLAFHVKPEHAFQALDSARSGPVPEGNVGGGTGMICYNFKGGIGTSSRKAGDYTVAALVQCNCGSREQLRIAGAPVGMEITENPRTAQARLGHQDTGSIIIVVATDAPLLPHQLKRLARRASLGLARTGSTSGNSSGDIFIAFSTANAGAAAPTGTVNLSMLANDQIGRVFEGTVQSVEEAIINAMVGAETMTGVNGHRVAALPHERVKDVLKKYNRLSPR